MKLVNLAFTGIIIVDAGVKGRSMSKKGTLVGYNEEEARRVERRSIKMGRRRLGSWTVNR